jgi:hypothetical protein
MVLDRPNVIGLQVRGGIPIHGMSLSIATAMIVHEIPLVISVLLQGVIVATNIMLHSLANAYSKSIAIGISCTDVECDRHRCGR